MTLQQDIKAKMIEAMKAKDQVKLDTMRGLLSAFTNEAVAKKKRPDEELSDEEVLAVISRAVKQRKDSIEQFEKGGRADLADSEKVELAILEAFLPAQMPKDEVIKYVKAKHIELGMNDPTKKNQFMGMVMKELKGKADGTIVKEAVDSMFTA